jgi:hypothetical protein
MFSDSSNFAPTSARNGRAMTLLALIGLQASCWWVGSPVSHDEFRRTLIAIAMRDYAGAGVAFSEGIEQQLSTVRTWWAAEELKERGFTIQVPGALRCRQDLEDFVRASGLGRMTESDIVVLYVTGHGITGGSRRHYLLLPDSDDQRLITTAYPMAALLDSQARNVLVVVNSCYAGKLKAELADLSMDLMKQRRELPSLAVFSSADFDEAPRILEFTELLRQVDKQLRSDSEIDTAYLSFEQFHAELRRAARRLELLQPISLWSEQSQTDPSPCLPNPRYREPVHLVEPARRQLATPVAELDYWLSRASGRVDDNDSSWYFSGREQLNRTIAGFLREGNGTLVVTGGAGTGKSAVIARAVALADPELRRRLLAPQASAADLAPDFDQQLTGAPSGTVPEAGSVDLAVLARGKDSAQLLGELVALAGGDEQRADSQQLRYRLYSRLVTEDRSWTIVIDGLDEAADPIRIISDVVVPLASFNVRLVLGLRSSTPGSSAGARDELLDVLAQALHPVLQVRTDGADASADLAAYVTALLAAKGPYADDEAARARAATAVARAVAPSFLDARFAGQQLREAAVQQALDDPAWLSCLQDGTVGLLRQDLHGVALAASFSAAELLAALAATAFAQGMGIPRAEIWPAVIEAILGHPVADPEKLIDEVLRSRLDGYLMHDTEGGRVVRRPAHERLAEILRREPHRLLMKDAP